VTGTTKPLPSLDDEVTREYWTAAADHRLLLPWCRQCDAAFFYPRRYCPRCWSDDLDWRPSGGDGQVWSYTFVHVPFYDDTWADDVPYCVAVVELDDGVRLVANLRGVEPDGVSIGDRVQVVFEDVAPGVTLPQFERSG
jgi:uncharacterized OB-fold protein